MPWKQKAKLIAAISLGIAFTVWRADAIAPSAVDAESRAGFSPLFARRLEVGLQNMDKTPDRVYVAHLPIYDQEPVATPLSGNPLSMCLASGCYLSICIGSACLNSRCLGSACITSGCGGSACITSGCGGSACIGSACGGSACVGSICLGSACVNCPPGEGTSRTGSRD